MIVRLTQDLSNGFQPEKDNDNKLTVIIDFESLEAMKAFGGHEELKAKRAAAGAILESTVITQMSGESFTR